MPFEPGQLTRESERITVRRLAEAREALDAEAAVAGEAAELQEQFEPLRRCTECGAKLTVQVLPHGYESVCTPCERRARSAG